MPLKIFTQANSLKRRQLNRTLGLMAASACLSASCFAQTPAAGASAYPNKPVRLIVGFPAGTGPDIVARLLGQKLSEAWGIGVVVDNKPGAGGLIAATEAARGPADGYTLMLGESGQLAITSNS